jgi:hypothetical protein
LANLDWFKKNNTHRSRKGRIQQKASPQGSESS